MSILMSMYNVWCNKILDGSKPIEFRNNIGKNFNIGETIYLYESGKNNGQKKIVGEVKIKDIKSIPKSKVGTYGMIEYYANNIITDKKLRDTIMYAYNYDLPNYDKNYRLDWMFLPWVLDELKTKDKLPDLFGMPQAERNDFFKKQKKAQQIQEECDDWLRSIGYYNEYDETFYKNYIVLENPIKYSTPLELSDFKNLAGEDIKRAPQSWCYAIKK